jgi:hypothetical protein
MYIHPRLFGSAILRGIYRKEGSNPAHMDGLGSIRFLLFGNKIIK